MQKYGAIIQGQHVQLHLRAVLSAEGVKLLRKNYPFLKIYQRNFNGVLYTHVEGSVTKLFYEDFNNLWKRVKTTSKKLGKQTKLNL